MIVQHSRAEKFNQIIRKVGEFLTFHCQCLDLSHYKVITRLLLSHLSIHVAIPFLEFQHIQPFLVQKPKYFSNFFFQDPGLTVGCLNFFGVFFENILAPDFRPEFGFPVAHQTGKRPKWARKTIQRKDALDRYTDLEVESTITLSLNKLLQNCSVKHFSCFHSSGNPLQMRNENKQLECVTAAPLTNCNKSQSQLKAPQSNSPNPFILHPLAAFEASEKHISLMPLKVITTIFTGYQKCIGMYLFFCMTISKEYFSYILHIFLQRKFRTAQMIYLLSNEIYQ